MTILDEGHLRFTFGLHHSVHKVDDAPFHRNRMCSLEGTRAVDFLALSTGSRRRKCSLFIEVKDFRGHHPENATRFRNDQDGLGCEVATKVRDVIASIVGGARTDNSFPWNDALRSVSDKADVLVVLWLEQDPLRQDTKDWASLASTLAEQIKKRLVWLNVKALVCCTTHNQLQPLGVDVQSLSGAAHPTAPGVPTAS